MAETIRDVIIRLSIQQVDTALKVPDYSAIVSGQSSVAASALKASSAVRDIGSAQTGALAVSKQALDEARAQVKRWQDEVTGAGRAAKEALEQTSLTAANGAVTSYATVASAARDAMTQTSSYHLAAAE